MNGKERVLSRLRFENSPDVRETRLLEDKYHERLNVQVWMWNDD